MIRDRISRPRSSVPKRCPGVPIPLNGRIGLIAFGSYGAMSGANTAMTTIKATMKKPTRAVLFLANLCQALFAFRSFTSIAILASIPSASPETTEDAAAGFFFFDNVITHHPFSSLTFGFRIA